MCLIEHYLQGLWLNDSINMSMDDLIFTIRLNGFKYLGATSKRLILEKMQ